MANGADGDKAGGAQTRRFRHETAEEVPVLAAFGARSASEAVFQEAAARVGPLRRLNAPWLVTPLRLEHRGTGEVLILERPEGEDLAGLIASGRPPVTEALRIVLRLVEALDQMHGAGLVHGRLVPEAVFLRGRDGRVQIAPVPETLRPRAGDRSADEISLRELAHLAPEQTGRVSETADHRADLYAAGTILFLMTEGRLPFMSFDRLELLHQIIAVPAPEAVSAPPALRRILARLLMKAPEDRYRSAWGLAEDLRRCLDSLERTGEADFEIGEADGRASLAIPKRLFGREAELARLRAILAGTDEAELASVSGYSGAGKSALVARFLELAAQDGALVISGKYDQLQTLPYKAVIEALRGHVQRLMARGGTACEDWLGQVRRRVGGGLDALVAFIPELRGFLGDRVTPAAMEPGEREDRFQTAVRGLFETLGSAEAPAILFLDDLQWADAASLRLIETVLTRSGARHLLILAAYRSNEVTDKHPVAALFARLGEAGMTVEDLPVAPLDIDGVSELVAATLRLPPAEVQPLARVLLAKTFGNPFQLRQLLTALHERGEIVFDRGRARWTWDEDRIRTTVMQTDIAGLLSERMARLSGDARGSLAAAACFGASFTDEMIGLVDRRDRRARRRGLDEAETEGLILRDPASPLPDAWVFSHDQVQAAAYGLMDPDEARYRHAQIGAALLRAIDDPETDSRLFTALDHVGRAPDFLTDPDLGRRLSRLGLTAARKAKSVAAYDLAVRILDLLAGLPAPVSGLDWAVDPALAWDVEIEQMEARFLDSGWSKAEPHFETLVRRAETQTRKALVHQLACQLLTIRVDYDRALQLGVEGARLMGSDIAAPLGPKIGVALARSFLRLRRPERFDFSSLPAMTDPHRAATMDLLITVATPAILSNADLFVLVSLRMYDLTLRYGLTDPGAASIANYAIVLYIAFGAVDRAYAIQTRLEEVFANRNISDRVKGRVIYGRAVILDWYKEPYAAILPKLDRAMECSRRAADSEFLGYSYYGKLKYLFAMGTPLAELRSEIEAYERIGRQLRHDTLLGICSAYRRMIESATRVEDRPIWTEADEAVDASQNNEVSKGTYYAAILLLAVVEQDWDLAETMRARLEAFTNYRKVVPGLGELLLQTAILSWETTAGAGGAAAGDKAARKVAARGRTAERELAKVARRYPVNLAHFGVLLEAWQTDRSKGTAAAAALWDKAIRACKEQGQLQYAALAADLAARGADRAGLVADRNRRLREARALYDQWGGTRRAAQLVAAWPDAFGDAPVAAAAPVDLVAITRAAQAIFESLDFGTLVRQLLTIAIKTAGADRGSLFGMEEGSPKLVAEARLEGGRLTVTMADPPVALEALPPRNHPQEIIRAVAEGRQLVLLDDAVTNPGQFGGDPCVVARRPRSVMCLPVMRSGSIEALMYLENAQSPRVFTPARRDVLETLLGLAAISLVNARLFARQEEALRLERRASEELSRLSRMKDEFLANTSHELRTPLNGIIGLAGSLAAGAKGPLPEAAVETLELLASAGRRLETLVHDILDFSHLRAGGLELKPVPVDLRGVTDVVLSILGSRIRDSGSTVENLVPEDVVVEADPDRLQQVLINLVDNAAKFGGGGEIRIEAERLGDRIEIAVTDSGIGVAPEHRERIFQSFEQIDASVAREHGGTGLGLAIVRQLVDLHGGQIRVADHSGPGARFVFDMPSSLRKAVDRDTVLRVRQAAVSGAAPASSATVVGKGAFAVGAQGRAGTVLVVDDDATNREVLENYLGLAGYRVASAPDGETALRLLSEGLEPQVALLDIMMPRMSGYELCRRIRESRPASRLPVIMLTAKNRVEDLDAAFDCGANDYIAKPFIREELLARIRSHGDLSRVNSAYERFVPSEFLRFLKRDRITDIELGDNVACHMAVMFTDIRNFTRLTEGMTPGESFDFLIEYFSTISPAVYDCGGFLNQYSGDGMMALFPGEPSSAMRAAVGIQTAMARFNATRKLRRREVIETGIGLHVGEMILGIIGHEHRRTGNVVSDSVNLASRIENLTAYYGISIAASRDVMDSLQGAEGFPFRELDLVRVKGRERPVTICEVFAADEPRLIDLKLATRGDFDAGVQAFRAGRFRESVDSFSAVLAANPADHAAANFRMRSAHLLETGAPAGWDGIMRIGKIVDPV